MAIGGALGPKTSIDGSGMRVEALAVEPALEAMNVVMMDDHIGETWAEIVGDDALMDMRIADKETGNNKPVKAASIAGMTATDVHANDLSITGGTASGATYADGTQTDGSMYRGIPGIAICAGTDCKVEGDEGSEKLTGSWYFTPDNAKTYYEMVDEDEDYTPETNYRPVRPLADNRYRRRDRPHLRGRRCRR